MSYEPIESKVLFLFRTLDCIENPSKFPRDLEKMCPNKGLRVAIEITSQSILMVTLCLRQVFRKRIFRQTTRTLTKATFLDTLNCQEPILSPEFFRIL